MKTGLNFLKKHPFHRTSHDLKSSLPLRLSIHKHSSSRLSLNQQRSSIALRREISNQTTVTDEEAAAAINLATKPRSFCSRFCTAIYKPFLRSTYQKIEKLDRKKYFLWKLRDALLCPPQGFIARLFTIILLSCIVYLLLLVVSYDEAMPHKKCFYQQNEKDYQNVTTTTTTITSNNNTKNEPMKKICYGGNLFGLYILWLSAMVVGIFVQAFGGPPLLGMLLAGLFFKNVPYPLLRVTDKINERWFTDLRYLALCIILTRAGLCLEPNALKRLSATVFRLAFIPCLVETAADALASFLILKFPWEWGFMLGFVLGAVSPAIVVLSMLKLEAQGYGVVKGIPTLVIAAASIDDVLAITGFTFSQGIAFNTGGSLFITIIYGPMEALAGIVIGCVGGIILWFIPYAQSTKFVFYRAISLICSGIILILGTRMIHFSGAGALGCLTLSFVAGYGWRQREGWVEETNPIINIIDKLWWIAQPFLFGLIGAEVNLRGLSPQKLGLGLTVVVIGLFFRMLAAIVAVSGIGLSIKEKIFISIVWLPKATVQAAIGSIALDSARKLNDPQKIDMGLQILTIAAIVIIITAPLGAILISIFGPLLMTKDNLRILSFDQPDGGVSDDLFISDTYNQSPAKAFRHNMSSMEVIEEVDSMENTGTDSV